MKIGVNCRSLLSKQYTGIGRYAYNLVKSLSEIDCENEYLLYAQKGFMQSKRILPDFGKDNFVVKRDMFNFGVDKTVGDLSVYHSPSQDFVNVHNAKIVVTVHDLVYKAFPQGHTEETLKLTDAQIHSFLPNVSKIICPSERTQKDFHKYFDIENSKLTVIPQGVDRNIFYAIDSEEKEITGEEITWEENSKRYVYNVDVITEIMEKVSNLQPQESIVIIAVEKPDALIKTATGLGLKLNIEQNREYRISIFNPEKIKPATDWTERKEDFEQLDVRNMQTDPFDIIIKHSYQVKEDGGFILIQTFEPYPMINMLNEMGFESVTKEKGPGEIWIYFHKKVIELEEGEVTGDKPSVVIQSATPVAYPVIMRLLQSEKIRKSIQIKELKVWEETEKHLSWIVNGKADISFSALITSAKLRDSDIKIPAMFVWDNFYILTRGYKASNLEDIKGKQIYTPLFEEAPPAKITKYLIKAKGLDVNDFNFVYGQPFGRPEEIFADFVRGTADTVILREPEASYAIKAMEHAGEDISIISYNEIWNDINENFGSFPNAGLVLKGEFARKYPELTQVFLEELKDAINWVNENKHESAKLSFDLMRQPVDSIELFLNRVKFEYVDGDELIEKVKAYFDILVEQGIVDAKIDDNFFDIFRM